MGSVKVEKDDLGRPFVRTKTSIKYYDIPSTVYGINPFTSFHHYVNIFPDENAKHGTRRTVRLNKETGVQYSHSSDKIRRYFMSDPKDVTDYYAARAAMKYLLRKGFLAAKLDAE